MALDGIAVNSILNELNNNILDGRIDKIHQPERDELIIHIRCNGKNVKLMLTANAENPRINFVEQGKVNPNEPPLFCMILRKHLQGGRIISISQPNFERIICIDIQSTNDFGDLTTKQLVIELMGRHSNIMLLNEDRKVIDSIKHINYDKSSVRIMLPGVMYENPPTTKINPLYVTYTELWLLYKQFEGDLRSFCYQTLTGVSPLLAEEWLDSCNLDYNATNIDESMFKILFNHIEDFFNNIKNKNFVYKIYSKDKKLIDFSVYDLNRYKDYDITEYDNISELLEDFYYKKDLSNRMSQKTYDLKKLIQNNIDRCTKKIKLQTDIIQDSEKREQNKIYGELLTANVYAIQKGDTQITVHNYYSDDYEEVTINIDPTISPIDNAQKYFKKYNKQKRAYASALEQKELTTKDLQYLESIMTNLVNITNEADIDEVKQELFEEGFIKKRIKKSKTFQKSKPLHFISCDGIDILVGKNNKQNDELTTKIANKNDMWLHTKDIAGSHVVIRHNADTIPDTTLNEAVMLAGFYSKGKNSTQVAIDYTPIKNVKKPNGAKPGMVIYTTNQTAYVTPDEDVVSRIKLVD